MVVVFDMAQAQGYGQFCPIARAAEILAERWTPLVVRELCLGSTRFNELQRGVPRMSPALLSRRLKDLEHAGIVERRPAGDGRGWDYRLTEAGRALYPILEGMGAWAQRWVRSDLTRDENLDPDLLMWDVRRCVTGGGVPAGRRFVVQFQFAGVPASRRRYWLVFDKAAGDGGPDLCIRDPGYEVDLYVSAPLKLLTEVWLGHVPVAEAAGNGRLALDGSRADVAAFAAWFTLSPTAGAIAG